MTTFELVANLPNRHVRLSWNTTYWGQEFQATCPVQRMTPALRAALLEREVEIRAINKGHWHQAALALLARVEDLDRRADLRLRYEERAGILEHDAGNSRFNAELLAYLEIAAEVDGFAEGNIDHLFPEEVGGGVSDRRVAHNY